MIDKHQGKPFPNITVDGKPLRKYSSEECLEILVGNLGHEACVTMICTALCRTIDMESTEPIQKRPPGRPAGTQRGLELGKPTNGAGGKLPVKTPRSVPPDPVTGESICLTLIDHPAWTAEQLGSYLEADVRVVKQIINNVLLPNKTIKRVGSSKPFQYEVNCEKEA